MSDSGRWYWAAFVFNLLVILGFWWATTGLQQHRSPGDWLNAAGRVTGLVGTYLVLWQLLLMTRQPWLDAAFGFERLARLHRWNGYLALGLLVAHAAHVHGHRHAHHVPRAPHGKRERTLSWGRTSSPARWPRTRSPKPRA